MVLKNEQVHKGDFKRPTRIDVAHRAGVSVAAVSYAFNHSTKISEQTKKKIFKVAEELGYRPSHIARSLSTRKTMQLSIMINDIANPIYADLISGFENEAVAQGYLVNVCNGKNHADEYFESIISRGIDGVLVEVMPYKFHKEKLIELISLGTNVVLFGTHGIKTQQVSYFEIDYIMAMELAVEHLISLGHSRLVYLSGLAVKDQYDNRIDGFIRACNKFICSQVDVLTFPILEKTKETTACTVLAPKESLTTSIEDGESLVDQLIVLGQKFSAVICTNDLMAIGVLRALKKHGLSVPHDVSVVGIDNSPLAALVSPSLTTIGPDYYFIGEEAFKLLHDIITEKKYGYKKFVPQLYFRESTSHFDP